MRIPHSVIVANKPPFNIIFITSLLISLLSLSACQTVPSTPTKGTGDTPISISTPVGAENNAHAGNNHSQVYTEEYVIEYDDSYDDVDYPIEPYIPEIPPEVTIIPAPVVVPPPIKTQPIPPLPPLSHSDLLERARQNSAVQSRQPVANNNDLPAFRRLMETGINQLKTGQLGAAESSFTRAQRIAPKSSAVYFYLAQVALKKNQPRKAEAMARRGLSVSEDASRRQALWQIILRSGQLQNSPRVIREAQQALR